MTNNHVKVDGDFDMDNPPQMKHNWIDRGLKLSCEDAGHPQHEVWKTKKKDKSTKE